MNKRLFVAGLPFSLVDKDLADLFSEFGDVVSASIITDRDSGRSKGFGFVELSTEEGTNAAIAKLNGSDLNGRKIVVNIARPREERPSGGFGGGRRDFRSSDNRRRGGFGGGRRDRH